MTQGQDFGKGKKKTKKQENKKTRKKEKKKTRKQKKKKKPEGSFPFKRRGTPPSLGLKSSGYVHFFNKEGNNAWKYSAATFEEAEDFSGAEEDKEAEENMGVEEGKEEESAAALPKLFQNSRPIADTLVE